MHDLIRKAFVVLVCSIVGARADQLPASGDIPARFVRPTAANDYVRREAMIPMRDGVKLYTVVVIPKNAHDAPIVLTRTPPRRPQGGGRE